MVDDLRDLLDDLLGDYFNYFVRDFLGNLVLRVKNCRLRDLEVSEVSPILNDVRFDALGHAVELRVDVCDGGMDREKSEKRTYTSDLYYGSITAFDTVNHKVVAKAITDIEIRSGALVTAGGVVFTALQDGWVIAYNDETLEELWRFNVGTPLKGAPVTYAIGPKQYLAVQSSGRHLHPVKFDKLEHSSYLFVFALN